MPKISPGQISAMLSRIGEIMVAGQPGATHSGAYAAAKGAQDAASGVLMQEELARMKEEEEKERKGALLKTILGSVGGLVLPGVGSVLGGALGSAGAAMGALGSAAVQTGSMMGAGAGYLLGPSLGRMAGAGISGTPIDPTSDIAIPIATQAGSALAAGATAGLGSLMAPAAPVASAAPAAAPGAAGAAASETALGAPVATGLAGGGSGALGGASAALATAPLVPSGLGAFDLAAQIPTGVPQTAATQTAQAVLSPAPVAPVATQTQAADVLKNIAQGTSPAPRSGVPATPQAASLNAARTSLATPDIQRALGGGAGGGIMAPLRTAISNIGAGMKEQFTPANLIQQGITNFASQLPATLASLAQPQESFLPSFTNTALLNPEHVQALSDISQNAAQGRSAERSRTSAQALQQQQLGIQQQGVNLQGEELRQRGRAQEAQQTQWGAENNQAATQAQIEAARALMDAQARTEQLRIASQQASEVGMANLGTAMQPYNPQTGAPVGAPLPISQPPQQAPAQQPLREFINVNGTPYLASAAPGAPSVSLAGPAGSDYQTDLAAQRQREEQQSAIEATNKTRTIREQSQEPMSPQEIETEFLTNLALIQLANKTVALSAAGTPPPETPAPNTNGILNKSTLPGQTPKERLEANAPKPAPEAKPAAPAKAPKPVSLEDLSRQISQVRTQSTPPSPTAPTTPTKPFNLRETANNVYDTIGGALQAVGDTGRSMFTPDTHLPRPDISGNMDLNNLPVVQGVGQWQGQQGTIGTAGIYDDQKGMEVVIPTIYDGKHHTIEEARKRYYETGQFAAAFKDVNQANAWAQAFHKREERRITPAGY